MGGDVLKVVGVGVFYGNPIVGEVPGLGAREDLDFAGEVLTGEGGGVVHDLLRGAVGDEVPAVLAGTGAEIEDIVGFADGVFVVFDNEDGVARSRRFSRAEMSRWLSRWWRPMEGSSRT